MMLSRAADSLYWLSRYLERAEHAARLIDVQIHLMLDLSPDSSAQRWRRLLESLRVPLPVDNHYDPYYMTDLLTFDTGNVNSIVSCISSARENARQLREYISSEMWEQINQLYFHVKKQRIDSIWEAQPHAFFVSVKEGIHLFQGITDSTMNYNEGYQFLQVGRYLERAASVAQLLDVHYATFQHGRMYGGDFLEWIGLLKSCTAFEAYCKVYMADLQPDNIADFLLLNKEFPHSIAFSLNRVQSALLSIAEDSQSHRARTPNRLAGRVTALVDYGQVDEVFDAGFHRFLNDLMRQCEMIHEAIYQAYVAYPVDREFAD
jgi:uncharacterized alpha-E superfamily protein